MKKITTFLIALAVAMLPLAPANAANNLLGGQKHYYTVQLRSDKQAIVYARIIFENPSSNDELSTYEFTLPKEVTTANLATQ